MILIGAAGQPVPQPTTQGHVQIQSTQIKVPLFLIDSLTTSLSFLPRFLHHHLYSQPVSKLSIWGKSRVVMREWYTRGDARASHFVAACLLPRVLSRFALLATQNGELALRILYSGIFRSTFLMTFMRRMCHLLMIIVFRKTLILNKSLFLIVKLNLLPWYAQ